MIEKPEDITSDQMAMFMANTLAKGTLDWLGCCSPEKLKNEYKYRFNILKNALKNYNDLHQADSIEELYEVHDEFQQIMGYMQRFNKGDNPAGAWSLLSMCVMYATDDIDGLSNFHRDLGIYISQIKFKK